MFDLIEPSLSGRLALLAVGGEQGPRLDRIAEGGAGAVGLDRIHVRGLQTGVCQRLAITRSWEGPLGAVSPLEAPSWLTARAADRRQHAVALGLGIGEALQDQHADALCEADAVGCLGEGLAATVGGEAALAGELDEMLGVASTVTPPARASEHSPERSAWEARCTRPARRSRRCRP